MTVHTHSQKLAQTAFAKVDASKQELKAKSNGFKEYLGFAKKFPALIHTCGLAQAVAFALAKKETKYMDDLSAVLHETHPEVTNRQTLDQLARTQELSGYLRLSRDAVDAAGWLKRYAEALEE